MRNFSSLRIAVIAALFALIASVPSSAQVIYKILGSTNFEAMYPANSYPNPFNDYYYAERDQFLVRASEMQAAGMPGGQIVSIAFEMGPIGTQPTRDFNIKMKTTTVDVVPTGTYANDLTLVHNNASWLPSTGINTYNFIAPFMWDGSSNLLIEVCTQRSGYTYNFPQYTYTTTPGKASHAYFYQDANGVCPASINPYGSYQQRPVVRFGVLSGITQSFPDDVDPRRVLRAGEVYGGQDAAHPKPSLNYRQTTGQALQLTYQIVSLVTGQPIYIATENGNANDTIINVTATSTGEVTYTFSSAKGSAASANGDLDLSQVPGGVYRVEATYFVPATNYKQTWTKEFNIAFSNDLSVRQIVAPNFSGRYPRGTQVPVGARFQNVGLNAVTSFRGIAVIRNSQGTEVYRDTINYSGSLNTGDQASLNFANFATLTTGTYSAQFCAELLGASDQQLSNNCLPTTGLHTFEVQYDTEVQAVDIPRPASTDIMYANRPFAPQGRFKNIGISDLSDVPAQMIIERLSPNPAVVYNVTVNIPDIAVNNTVQYGFPLFTPPTAGSYRVCIIALAADDPVRSNDTVCSNFTVNEALSGTYTIGTQFQGGSRNFPTMQDAVNALYRGGVGGPVVFEMTDANYTVGSAALNLAALDIRATIIGVNATNTITFKPSQQRSTTRSSVNISLRSGSGIGILLGETYAPTNTNAIITETKSHGNANATGYITFDGGIQKSLKFTLESNAAQRAVFYLGSESNNTTIRNVIIENSPNSTASYQSSLPRVIFNQSDLTFSYEGDVRTQTNGTINTYSAGVVIRNMPTSRNDLQGVTNGVADTNTSDNNRVIGNEISGFGFGVVGIGIGPLYKPSQGRFSRYYMKGLEVRDNQIQNVSRAGVYVANTEGAEISGNRIANVGQTATGVAGEASGVRTGGESSYNNMNMRIARNEISGVTSSSFVRGIAVEQVEQEFLTGSGAVYRFPDEGGRNKTTSNIIWGMGRTSGTGYAAGIHYFTQRSATQTGLNQLLTPQRVRFFTTQDTIAGNTVIMGNDGQTGAGIVAGIGVQQARAAVVYNNAIAVLGGATTATTANTALLFESMLNQTIRTGSLAGTMTADAIKSNRNAFWTPNATIARLIRVDDQSRTVSMGSYDEYTTLGQWRQGTGQDMNSVYGDWTTDYQYTGTAPLQRLRVKTNLTPIGSILNNRGEYLSNLGNDIDNEVRGAAGQRPDIGGDEFNGRLYVNDIESVEIIRPGSYRSQTGSFRDAEYVMTQAPVNVTARVRNGGSIAQANAPVTLRIYEETAGSAQVSPIPVPALYNAQPVLTTTLRSDYPAGESVDIEFNNLNFTPRTYADLGMASTTPAQFRTMAQNVTPRYRIEIETISDENNSNNITSKEVRFYLVKSPIRMIASVRGSTVNMTASPTANQIAGRLNGDSLRTALRTLGWDNNGTTVGVYDLLDRDNWEPRSVDYTPYRTLLWAQDMNRLSFEEREDMTEYVFSGSITNKKNLAISSQEIARQHIGFDPANDEGFVRGVLRSQYVAPGTPFTPNYDGKRVIGVAVAEATADVVRTTQFAGDAAPVPALLRVYSDALTEGLARTAYKYETRSSGVADSVMGVASTATYANIVYLGVDWRHFARTNNQSRSGVERVLRGVMDFFEKNGGTVVPVELAGGLKAEALRRDNAWTVNLWWKVASEVNVAGYTVERSEATAKGMTEFTTVATNAPGKVNYQVEDRSVEAGRTYVYRLRSTDRDGSFSLSNEVEVSITGDNAQAFTMAPMPVVNTATLEYDAATEGDVQFIVFDAQGREVMSITGTNGKADFNASMLSSGAYSVQMMVNGATNGTIAISVIK